jgi:hypothetical protein
LADYFTKDTDVAIGKFIRTDDIKLKHELFDKEIRPAFEKLIENLIYVYSFYTIDDADTLKRECLTNLYEMLPKFNPDRGTKGFSYFNVVAKNWFVMRTREKNKRSKMESEFVVDIDHEIVLNDPSLSVSPYEDVIEDREKWLKFFEAMDSWRGQLTKKTEREVLEAVTYLMKNPHLVNIYNKKAIFLYLREMTDLNTKQVIVNLKKIKNLYNEWLKEYEATGE